MKLKLTYDQMKDYWMKVRRLNTEPLSSSVTRIDGVAMDEIIEQQIVRWYDRLLLNADLHLLQLSDITRQLELYEHDGFFATAPMPDGTYRIASVKCRGWYCPAQVVMWPDAARRRRLASKFTTATPASPVAVVEYNTLYIYPFTPGETVEYVKAVVKHDGVYEFDSTALTTLLPDDIDFTI